MGKGYAWEGTFERSWDAIEEDELGQLKIDRITTTKERQRYSISCFLNSL